MKRILLLATNATYQWVNCTEWTDCISVTTIGLEERSPNGVVVYPNPSK
ncbi:MAG: hypothetical protein VW808_04315 [Schleiferiaceae bacterium]